MISHNPVENIIFDKKYELNNGKLIEKLIMGKFNSILKYSKGEVLLKLKNLNHIYRF